MDEEHPVAAVRYTENPILAGFGECSERLSVNSTGLRGADPRCDESSKQVNPAVWGTLSWGGLSDVVVEPASVLCGGIGL